MGLEQLVSGVGSLVEGWLSDLCDLEDIRYLNDSGDQRVDEANSIIITNVPCSFEAMSKKHQDMFPAGMLTTAMSHFLTLIKNEGTLSIKSNFIIRVHAKPTVGNVAGHGEYVFEKPGRLDYSFSPLVGVGATLRDQ